MEFSTKSSSSGSLKLEISLKLTIVHLQVYPNHSNDKHSYAYSKMMMKTILFVLISCYSIQEWIEHWKRKQLVKKELTKMKPRLQFFKSNGEFWSNKWQKFKEDYNVTSATMQSSLRLLIKSSFSAQRRHGTRIKLLSSSLPMQKNFFESS